VRILLLGLGLMLALSGCAVPTAVTIASFAADGVSYIATGKSTTDHALSIIAQEDCAMMRVLEEKAICTPDIKLPVQTAKAEPSRELPDHASQPIAAATVPASPPTAWDFPLIHKEAVSDAPPPASPRLVAKETPARPAAELPVGMVEHRHPTPTRRAGPPLASGGIVLARCSESTGMRPAAQCGLGPGA